MLYVRRWALRRGFEAFPEDAQRVVKRRDVAFPGQRELDWYAGYMSCQSQVAPLPCSCMVSDAVHTP